MSNIASLEKVLPFCSAKNRKAANTLMQSKNGTIRLMPLTLRGAMFVIINNVFLSFGRGHFLFLRYSLLDASTIETLNGLKVLAATYITEH